MEYWGITDIGLLRSKNQDNFLTIKNAYDDILLIIADGIGGGKAGDVASLRIVTYFKDIFLDSGPFASKKDMINFLQYHLTVINKLIFNESINNIKYSGMGSTITGMLISKNERIVFNCGDSRVYGIYKNNINALTKDDNLLNKMIDEQKLPKEIANNHPKKNYLVRAIGIFEKVNFSITSINKMDYYLLCSDGLYGYMSEDEILEIILNEKSVEDKVVSLKDLALFKGGYDNISLILFKE